MIKKIFKYPKRLLVAVLSLLMIISISPYFTFDPKHYFVQQREVYMTMQGLLYLHIVPSLIALVTGAYQMFPFLLNNRGVHLWSRRLYYICSILGGITGLLLAPIAYGGLVSTLGLGILAVLWIITSLVSLYYLMNKRMQPFRKWIIRSYAFAFAAVTLRLWLPIMVITIGFDKGYPIATWLSWIPNILIIEWIRRGKNLE